MFVSTVVTVFVIAALCALAFGLPSHIVPPVTTPPTNYQKWAHLHWVWVKNSDGNQVNVTNLVQGYKDNNIPVGAVNIDSTWATQFNNFEIDKTRFPDFAGLVNQLHSQDIRVILWATSMVNTENPDYDFCVQNKYLLRDSKGVVRPISWWHGTGGLLDYSNPDAVAWWHSKMDQVLNVHVDGFKCDGTDPYILEYILAGGALGYNDQKLTYRDYANYYYRDFFYYTREKNKYEKDGVIVDDNGLIMSRPVDCLVDQGSKVCQPFSPKDVMYSGWVGDDDGTFEGLRGCMHKVIYSAWSGYGSFGCDIAGYRYKEELKNKRYFLRSAQLNAFFPLMENGGGGEHRPWMYDAETVDIYRKFVNEHYRLSTYTHTIGANAVDQRISTLIPVDERHIDSPDDRAGKILYPQPHTYSFRLGHDVLVHPVLYDGRDEDHRQGDVGIVEMVFPADGNNNSTLWLDWWRPHDLSRSFSAGQKKIDAVPLNSYSVFVRAGAFIPLHDYKMHTVALVEAGPKEDLAIDLEAPIFTWFQPMVGPAPLVNTPLVFQMRESVSTGRGQEARAFFADESRTTLYATISARSGPAGLAFVGIAEPKSVDISAWPTARCRQHYSAHDLTLRVYCGDVAGGLNVAVKGLESL